MNASRRVTREAMHLFRACLHEGHLDETRVREVVEELGTAKPRGYLAILSAFRRFVELEAERHQATVETALPLPGDLQTRLLRGLGTVYGPGLNVAFSENPALIGGMRIRVGSDVYDGSIRGRLTNLERSF